jgi:hypothetical protein
VGLRIDVYEGVGKVRPIDLEPGSEVTVGRTQSCDVVVSGAGVSRLHCTFSLVDGAALVTNHSSTKGGTRVNGEKIDESRGLEVGDEITVGKLVMVVAGGSAPAKVAEPTPASEPSDEQVDDGEEEAAEPPQEPRGEKARGRSGRSRSEDDEEASKPPPKPGAERGRGASARARVREPEAAADEAMDEAEPSARDAAREFLERKRLERNVKLVVGIAALGLVSGVGAFAAAKFARTGGNGTPGSGPVEAGPRPPDGRPRPPSGLGSTPAELGRPTSADQAWHRVQVGDPDAIPELLAAFAEAFPDDRRAEDASFFAQQLRAARSSASSHQRGSIINVMLSEARRLEAAQDPSRAQAVLELVQGLLPGSPQAREAKQRIAALRSSAADGVSELRGKAQALSARLGPVQAILLVLEEQSKLRGLGQDAALDALVADLERAAAERYAVQAQPTLELSGEAHTVEKRALDKALAFDFPGAWEQLEQLLLLSLSDEGRLRAHWLRHQVRGLERLLAATLEAAKGPPSQRPTLTLGGDLRARLKEADHERLTLVPVVKNGSGELEWRWGRVTPYQVEELFAGIGERSWELTQAKAFYAFRTGLDDLGVELVLPFTHHKRLRAEVFSFYALATGTPLPAGGFVVFEGRLIDPAEKERIIAARVEAREAAKELARASREERNQKKLQGLLAKVLALMDEGHYASGRAALAKLAERHADVPGVGDVARRRLESPMLRRRDVRVTQKLGRNGPSANRLDIYFMGDGFVLDDRKQIQFDRYADSAVKACQLQDFFKEYDEYINYWAVNLASKEEGLTKDGERKDTALGTEINGGVYTVGGGRARMFGLLQTWFPGEHDRLAVSVGNDFATVATGGGGTVAVAKTMVSVTPHELGHAYGGLGDEYDQEPGPNPGPPQNYSGPARVISKNIVAGTNRAAMLKVVPWKEWLDPTGNAPWNWTKKPIDLFEGANRQPRGYWRPQRGCVMRDSGTPFCAVCMDVMVRRLYQHVKPIDMTWPEETELTAGRKTITLRVVVMKPKTHALFVHWRRETLELFGEAGPQPEVAPDPEDPDGTRVRRKEAPKVDPKEAVKDVSGKLEVREGRFVHYIQVRPGGLKPGRYAFSAEVWDPTPWVRNSKDVLNQTHRWVVTVPAR